MDKKVFSRRVMSSPSLRESHTPIYSTRDNRFIPDNSAIETLLTPNDDGSLPDISVLMNNPKYQAALQDFSRQYEPLQSILDTSQFTDEQLAEYCVNNQDANDAFWSFYESAKLRYEEMNKEN